MNTERLLEMGREVISIEAAAAQSLIDRVNDDFVQACQLMLACEGRVVVLGMGKSGHIGGKIAATLASTGTPAFFVHPGEASHGDMGMITATDVVLALSNSGETEELRILLPLIKRMGVPLISMCGRVDSSLAESATVNIDVSVEREACPLDLAPTTSTTAALVMGDALAIALLEVRGFKAEDFALSHPGGSLGRRLLLKINDIMHTREQMPKVRADVPLGEALIEMTRKGLGVTAVVNEHDHVLGIYTDGDLRRTLDKDINIHAVSVAEVMSDNCKTIHQEQLAAEALAMMEQYRINAILVVDDDDNLIGVLNMHDLLRAGVV